MTHLVLFWLHNPQLLFTLKLKASKAKQNYKYIEQYQNHNRKNIFFKEYGHTLKSLKQDIVNFPNHNKRC